MSACVACWARRALSHLACCIAHRILSCLFACSSTAMSRFCRSCSKRPLKKAAMFFCRATRCSAATVAISVCSWSCSVAMSESSRATRFASASRSAAISRSRRRRASLRRCCSKSSSISAAKASSSSACCRRDSSCDCTALSASRCFWHCASSSAWVDSLASKAVWMFASWSSYAWSFAVFSPSAALPSWLSCSSWLFNAAISSRMACAFASTGWKLGSTFVAMCDARATSFSVTSVCWAPSSSIALVPTSPIDFGSSTLASSTVKLLPRKASDKSCVRADSFASSDTALAEAFGTTAHVGWRGCSGGTASAAWSWSPTRVTDDSSSRFGLPIASGCTLADGGADRQCSVSPVIMRLRPLVLCCTFFAFGIVEGTRIAVAVSTKVTTDESAAAAPTSAWRIVSLITRCE
mmetsp:Transcript_52063/g.160390  ORF Transcript_52063/g.160390 Transcript_52063/m.160390 type:complete len:409 (+) Transcript_52063:627-1853(+)